MAVDEELFFARRLGYGLGPGEAIEGSVRDWAIGQISSIPPLDFFGIDGGNIRSKLPDYADPIADIPTAAKVWGTANNIETKLQLQVSKMSNADWQNALNEQVYKPRSDHPYWRDALVQSATATGGGSPVFERFWQFWVNHFAVQATPYVQLFYGPHTREIRARMTSTFADMAKAAVLNPAMLFFLDNHLSTGPHSQIGRHTRETINENLGRELLELHTVSPAAGYTQKDVTEVAYILSGWSISGHMIEQKNIPKSAPYGTYFDIMRHEPGSKTVMGKTYKNGRKGDQQALQLIEDLAVDPNTATHLATKLARHFVADYPADDSIGRIRDAWMQSKGDLITVHTAVIDEAIAKGPDNPKFTTPQNWVYLAHRTAHVDLPLAEMWGKNPQAIWVSALLEEMGQAYAGVPQPNGWSDLAADWLSKELINRRLRYALKLGSQAPGSVAAHLDSTAQRIAGADSDVAKAVTGATSVSDKAAILLSSPEFMRI